MSTFIIEVYDGGETEFRDLNPAESGEWDHRSVAIKAARAFAEDEWDANEVREHTDLPEEEYITGFYEPGQPGNVVVRKDD